MHAAIIRPALCACSWTGMLSMKAPCPACGRTFSDRVDAPRLALLRALSANPLAPRDRARLARLVELGLVRATGARPPGSEVPRAKRPLRPYAPTPAGWHVLGAADRTSAHDRVEAEIARLGAEHQPPEGWDAAVLRKVEP